MEIKNAIDAFLRGLPVDCESDKLNGMSCKVQFIIEDLGKYIMEFKDGICSVVTGNAIDPEITITADERSFVQWVFGITDIPVKGDLSVIGLAFDKNVLARKMMENIYTNANKRTLPHQ
jgi:hypothetical protein